ncbi:hypothetical protein D3C78_906380 [compost metagenome]
MRSKLRSNQRKKAFFSPCWGLSSSAARAGDRVRATRPEITTEMAMVIANCL